MSSCWGTIRRIQRVSIATQKAKLASEPQARHDPLTGALNRFGLLEKLDSAVQDAAALAFFHLDLDDFKIVNDRYGHQAGDRLLQQVTERLRQDMPPGSVVARLGGDEFVLLVPGLGKTESGALASGLVEQISTARYAVETGIGARIGVSIGFACAPDDAQTAEALYRQTDFALYAAKAAGKGAWRGGSGAAQQAA
jgi:diguanylate cyclase (GGDEF)-like protein